MNIKERVNNSKFRTPPFFCILLYAKDEYSSDFILFYLKNSVI